MFKNYLMAAYRAMTQRFLYSLLNIFGLVIGISASIITALYVTDEFSYDKWIPDVEQIYRLETTYNYPGRAPKLTPSSMMPVKTFLKETYSEIESVGRLVDSGISLTYEDTMFGESMSYIDPEIFGILGLEAIEGSLVGIFQGPTEMVITRTVKEKFFGDEAALGKTLIVDGDVPYEIVAVIEDLPHNTHLEMRVMAPISAPNFYWRDRVDTRWDRASAYTYIKVMVGTDVDALEASFDKFINRYVPTVSITGIDLEGSEFIDFSLRPITDIYLGSDSQENMLPGGDLKALIGMITIVFLLLVIGVINYTNLTTARYTLRTKEVAMRKVLGASRRQLIVQFLGDSMVFALISFGLALIAVEVLLPFFNSFVNKGLTLSDITNPSTALIILLLVIGVGLVGGIYPALIVTKQRPNLNLGGREKVSGSASYFQQGLVVFQFSISLGLIIAAAVVYNQNNFLRDMNLGYQSSDLVVVRSLRRGPEENGSLHQTLKDKFLTSGGVLSVSSSAAVPSDQRMPSMIISHVNEVGLERKTEAVAVSVGFDFFETYKIDLISGRGFSEDFQSDILTVKVGASDVNVGGVVINQAALRQLGYSEEKVIGQNLLMMHLTGSYRYEMMIIGVVPDVHLRSAHDAVGPAVFYSSPRIFNSITVRIDPARTLEVFDHIENAWNSVLTDQNIEFGFLDDALLAQYQNEQNHRTILSLTALLTVFVSSLGLFSLAAFAVQRKTKEIGVRKVLGAGIVDIVKMMFWKFLKPVLWSNIIGWPVAWVLMGDWLNSFAYRIDLNLVYFIGASFTVLIIAGVTISVHAIQAARTNPILALRNE